MSIRKFTLTGLACTLGVLVFSTAPALAAAPETPETGKAEPIGAESATLHGVLNPLNAGEPGSYQFAYAPAETGGCAGAFAPESLAFASGKKEEKESVTVTKLEPNKEYAFCIIAYGLGGVSEATQGAAVPFKTLAVPPKVESGSESAGGVSLTEASFGATINPNNQKTSYFFEYSTSEAEVLAGKGTPVAGAPPGGELEGFGGQGVGVSTGAVLSPDTTYFYRVVAKNATGTTKGAVNSFATVAVPHTEPVTEIKATEAKFNGTLTPLNKEFASEYSFVYKANNKVCIDEFSTGTESAGTGSGSKAVSTLVTGLEPSTRYAVCAVSSNAFGSDVATNTVEFETLAAPPTVEAGSEAVSGLTPFETQLEAKVNANNQTTEYAFEYATEAALIGHPGAKTIKGTNSISGYFNSNEQANATVPTGRVLTPATKYFYRVLAENTSHEKAAGKIEEFTTLPAIAPNIENEYSSAIGPETVTLNAQTDPESQETTCGFEYATEAALIGHPGATTVACPEPLGEGPNGVTGSLTLTGLKLHTTYYYRALATNATETTTDPTIESFETEATTAPTIEDEAMSPNREESLITKNQTESTAELTAKINPNGAQTTYRIEYGTTTAYTSSTPPAVIAPQDGAVPISQAISGLSANTTYHWRLIATSKAGTSTSVDHTFAYAVETGESPAPPVEPPSGEVTTSPPAPAPAAVFPLLSYPTIAALDAKEAQEAKGIPNPVVTKTLTMAEKLKKALKACKKKKGASRAKCERAAHKKFGPSKKKKS